MRLRRTLRPLQQKGGYSVEHDSLAEATGVPDAEIRQKFRETTLVLEQGNVDCWMRLKKPEDAQLLVAQLQKWLQGSSAAGN